MAHLVGGKYHGLLVVVSDDEDEVIVGSCVYRRLYIGKAKTAYFDFSERRNEDGEDVYGKM